MARVKFIGSHSFVGADNKKHHYKDGEIASVNDADLKILVKSKDGKTGDYILATDIEKEEEKKDTSKK